MNETCEERMIDVVFDVEQWLTVVGQHGYDFIMDNDSLKSIVEQTGVNKFMLKPVAVYEHKLIYALSRKVDTFDDIIEFLSNNIETSILYSISQIPETTITERFNMNTNITELLKPPEINPAYFILRYGIVE